MAKSQLSGGKLSKALAAKIQRDRRQGLRDRLDQEADRQKALKKARKEREKRKSRGDILDDESELSSVNPITHTPRARRGPSRSSSTCWRSSGRYACRSSGGWTRLREGRVALAP